MHDDNELTHKARLRHHLMERVMNGQLGIAQGSAIVPLLVGIGGAC
jgi:hypothetical protein